MWAYITSWFTPTSLFLLFNLVVGTIFIISRISPAVTPRHDHSSGTGYRHPLDRPPSLIDRVKSIRFSHYKFEQPETHFVHNSDDPTPLARPPSFLQRVKSINFQSIYQQQQSEVTQQTEVDTSTSPVSDYSPQFTRNTSFIERMKSINFSLYRTEHQNPDPDHHVTRSRSETRSFDSEKKQEKMKKSASEKMKMVLNDETEESVENRRPKTTRIEKTTSFGDEEVDAKADDFISKFKNQLKLQRLDSLLRYKEMIKGK